MDVDNMQDLRYLQNKISFAHIGTILSLRCA